MKLRQPQTGRVARGVMLFIVAALIVVTIIVVTTSLRQDRRPNVLLISLDTTRKDHMSIYGYPRRTTPNIDALAADSLVFDRCVATSNWTLPTHASMLTGLLPPSHGAHFVRSVDPHVRHVEPAARLAADIPTLAEIMGDADYRTGAIIANWWWLGRPYGLDRGFDTYDHRRGRPPAIYRRAAEIINEVRNWLADDRERPFFLFVNFMDPHIPYAPPPPYDKLFGEHSPPPAASTWGFYSDVQNAVIRTGLPLPQQTKAFLIDRYDGEIAYLDEQLGRLLEWMRENELYERTLIIVTADHGEAFGEHGAAGHGVAMYESELAAPMIVKLPGNIDTGRLDHPVQHTDIVPTVLETLALPVPAGIHGRSMLSEDKRDLLAVQYPREATIKLNKAYDRTQWALYREEFKLIEYSNGQRELYKLSSDRKELHDLSLSRPADVAEMSVALQRLRATISEKEPIPTLPSDVDEETLRKLRSLGYTQ